MAMCCGVQKTADSAAFVPTTVLEDEEVISTESGPARNGSGPDYLDASEQLQEEHVAGDP